VSGRVRHQRIMVCDARLLVGLGDPVDVAAEGEHRPTRAPAGPPGGRDARGPLLDREAVLAQHGHDIPGGLHFLEGHLREAEELVHHHLRELAALLHDIADWKFHDGDDTVGQVETNNNWSVRNTNSAGAADASFNYGFTPGYPVVGDWDGDGDDTPGSVNTGGTWALRNASSGGAPDGSFQFGFPGAVPVIW